MVLRVHRPSEWKQEACYDAILNLPFDHVLVRRSQPSLPLDLSVHRATPLPIGLQVNTRSADIQTRSRANRKRE